MHRPATCLRLDQGGCSQQEQARAAGEARAGHLPAGSGAPGFRVFTRSPAWAGGTCCCGGLGDGQFHPLEPGTELHLPLRPAALPERAECVAPPVCQLDLGSEPENFFYPFDLDKRYMPGPEARRDGHLASGVVKDHPEPRGARREVREPGNDQDGYQESAREEEPHHDETQAEADEPACCRHGTQPAGWLPAFSRHMRIMRLARIRGGLGVGVVCRCGAGGQVANGTAKSQ